MAEEEKFSEQNSLENLLQENIRLTKEIHHMSKRVNRYVTIQNILSAIYFLLIVAPLIIGAIYLPSLLGNYLNPYLELLNENKGAAETIQGYDSAKMMDIVNQAQKMINNK